MAGFSVDKTKETERGGFAMKKVEDQGSENHEETDPLPDYLEMRREGDSYVFSYLEDQGREQVFEVIFHDSEIDVELSDEEFTRSDYEQFLEYAGRALEDSGELENAYTLLEQVDNYA